jgi:hypothetical protein
MGQKRRVRLKGAADTRVSIDVRSKKAKLVIELSERTRRRLLELLQRSKPKKKKK